MHDGMRILTDPPGGLGPHFSEWGSLLQVVGVAQLGLIVSSELNKEVDLGFVGQQEPLPIFYALVALVVPPYDGEFELGVEDCRP
jgi:hypothetical protein